MIALRFLPLALLAGAGQAQMVTNDVPPPRALQPVGIVLVRGAMFVPVAYRETPPVMCGSTDRYVPVDMLADMDEFDEGAEDVFADADFADIDDGFFGR